MPKTVQLDVTTTVPVEVLQDALASRALELLKREITVAAKRAVSDFIAHGISAEVEKLAIHAEKSTIKVS